MLRFAVFGDLHTELSPSQGPCDLAEILVIVPFELQQEG